VNLIVEREKGLLEFEQRIAALKDQSRDQPIDLTSEIAALEAKYTELQREIFGKLSPWERVHMSRHPKRPLALDYLAQLDAFDELHGDRHYRDDPAVVGGFAKLDGRRIVVIAQEKGRDTKEKLHRNFGMPAPEGYRKVKRLIALAVHLRLPIVTFVDTPGADPGIGSEERAQSEAIASCLSALAQAPVPVVATVIGEGGSGGALALALADYVLMLEYSIYSVASPEGCAAILWGDAGKAEEAAERLRLTSEDLHRFGIVDEVIGEPLGGAHRDQTATIRRVLDAIDGALGRLETIEAPELLDARYAKYRRIGGWEAAGRAAIEERA
jgi:acetyl-CoA carboxylase carboxyl transferase subunit alpha